MRNRARALRGAALAQIDEHRAKDPDAVDAVVAVEANVLGRDDGVAQVRRHVIERDFQIRVLRRNRKDRPTVGVVEHGALSGLTQGSQLILPRQSRKSLI